MPIRMWGALTLGLVLAACAGRITPETYERVESGMSRAQVHELFGAPNDVRGAGVGSIELLTEEYRSRSHVVTITYSGDRVAFKSIETLRSSASI